MKEEKMLQEIMDGYDVLSSIVPPWHSWTKEERSVYERGLSNIKRLMKKSREKK